MATPPEAAQAAAASITTGSITNSAFVLGNNNKVAVVNGSPGATVVQVDHIDPPTRRADAPTSLPLTKPTLFLGREADATALLNAVQASPIVTVLLCAENGMGKTSLVSKIFDALAQANPNRKVVYLNSEFKHGAELEFVVYDAFFDRSSVCIVTHTKMAEDLRDYEALLIVDNVAVSNNDLRALRDLAPKCSFVLITSTPPTIDGSLVFLKGLPDEYAEPLFEKKIPEPLDDTAKQDATQICELLKGVPDLIITAALRTFTNEEAPGELLSELKTKGLDAASLANLTTEKLDANQKKVLMYLAVAGEETMITDKLLAELQKTRFPDLDVNAIVNRLIALNLAKRGSPRYNLCGTLPTVIDKAWDLTAARNDMLDIATNWLPGQQPSEAVKDSLPFLLLTLRDAAERKKWSEVVKLGRSLERFIFYYGWWQAWEDVLHILLQAAKAIGDRFLEGWAHHQLGSRALAYGTLDVAASSLNEALKIRQSIHDGPGLEVTRQNLDLLKALGGPTNGNGAGRGGTGGRPLTYGFFGFAGLVVLALAGYMVFRPKPPAPSTPQPLPPVAVKTSTPLAASSTPTLTLTSTLTVTPTQTLTETATPTLGASPTDTLSAPVPVSAVVASTFLFCRYGPGAAYLANGNVTLQNGDQLQVQGWAETALGNWLFVTYTPRFSKPEGPCWVSTDPRYVQVTGDITTLPQVDPHRVFPFFTDPRYVPSRFPPPTVTDVSFDGKTVAVSVEGVDLIYNNPNSTDREDRNSPIFLVEIWVCQNGKQLLNPQGIEFAYDPSQPTASGAAYAQDDGSCGQLPYGNAYLAHRDGYVGPVPFKVTH